MTLMKRFAEHRGIALSTLGRLTVNSSSLADRLKHGRVTIATVERLHQWLSDHWPADLAWPQHIPRPPAQKDAA